tara:strand:- start:7080 stop:7256 length:177 start_codon:yes stop_codon:yes gene_type:complete
MNIEYMDLEQKQQYLDYLKRLKLDQDEAIANGDSYINKSWRFHAKLTIKQLTASIAKG